MNRTDRQANRSRFEMRVFGLIRDLTRVPARLRRRVAAIAETLAAWRARRRLRTAPLQPLLYGPYIVAMPTPDAARVLVGTPDSLIDACRADMARARQGIATLYGMT